MSGWLKGYSFTCTTVDYSDGPLSRRVSVWDASSWHCPQAVPVKAIMLFVKCVFLVRLTLSFNTDYMMMLTSFSLSDFLFCFCAVWRSSPSFLVTLFRFSKVDSRATILRLLRRRVQSVKLWWMNQHIYWNCKLTQKIFWNQKSFEFGFCQVGFFLIRADAVKLVSLHTLRREWSRWYRWNVDFFQ